MPGSMLKTRLQRGNGVPLGNRTCIIRRVAREHNSSGARLSPHLGRAVVLRDQHGHVDIAVITGFAARPNIHHSRLQGTQASIHSIGTKPVDMVSDSDAIANKFNGPSKVGIDPKINFSCVCAQESIHLSK